MMIKERQSYDREFKQKAVELSFARGNAKEIAEELFITLQTVKDHTHKIYTKTGVRNRVELINLLRGLEV